MTSRGVLSRLRSARGGAAAIEFAIILPVALLLAAAAFELGQVIQSYSAANKLASQYALAWSDCIDQPAGTCNTEITQYRTTSAIHNVAPQLTGTVTLKMFQVTMSGSTPTVVYAYPSGSTPNSGQTAAAQAALASGQTGVVVTVGYTYTIQTFAAFLSGIIAPSFPMSFTVAQLKA